MHTISVSPVAVSSWVPRFRNRSSTTSWRSCSPIPGDVEAVQGPMFVLTGTDDFVVPPEQVVETVYVPALVPSLLGVLIGGDHGDPTGDGAGYRGYLTAWFALCLRGDTRAADAFTGPCELCDDPDWILRFKRGE